VTHEPLRNSHARVCHIAVGYLHQTVMCFARISAEQYGHKSCHQIISPSIHCVPPWGKQRPKRNRKNVILIRTRVSLAGNRKTNWKPERKSNKKQYLSSWEGSINNRYAVTFTFPLWVTRNGEDNINQAAFWNLTNFLKFQTNLTTRENTSSYL
jgi:hypothetical protein